jgi:YesN/AraC family two-component response regulator
MHGGTLQLASRPGHGTTCHVMLPMHQASVAGPVDAEASAISLENMLEGALFQAGELTRRIAAYIVENYTNPIARDDIAEALKVSPNYVSRLFRKETGMSPWQYLNRYRVAQAQKLLISTNHNVTEVASLVGIGDPAYFVRVFHKETGKSPQQYRKSAKM